ncbi:MAG: lipid A-modifier LpxR family protein, partial [Phycisphaerales bacterium]
MKMRSRTTIALLTLLLTWVAAPLTHAQDERRIGEADPAGALADSLDEQESWSPRDMRLRDATLYWDNDGTFVNLIDNTDRYYTNGLGIEVSFDPDLPSSLKDRLAPAGEWDDPRFGFGLALKQRIYTSEFITQTNPPADDHPYGG